MQASDYKKLKFIISVLFYGIIAVMTYFTIKYCFAFALPFIIGGALALLLHPLVRFLKAKLKIPEGISSAVFVFVFYAAIATVLIVLLSTLYDEIIVLKDSFPNIAEGISKSLDSFIENISAVVKEWPEYISQPVLEFLGTLSDNITKSILDFANNLSINFASTVKSVVDIAARIAGQLPNVFLFIVALILSTLFITRDMPTIKAFVYLQLPEKIRMAILEAREFLVLTIFRYIRAYAILMSLTFAELSLGFLIIGVPYPFLVAIIIALIDILPVFGCGTVLIPWALISLVNQNFKLALSLVILYLIITVIRQIVEPKVVGSQIGLSPLITLFCIYVGFKVLGVLGMFVFPILFITLRKLQEAGYLKIYTPIKKQKKDE